LQKSRATGGTIAFASAATSFWHSALAWRRVERCIIRR
jgi:hypothetical protein